jgi:ABC-type branched-subunit amino acid transport system substrate-binding protein
MRRLAFALALALTLASSAGAEKEPIVLGMSAAFSGPSAALGIELYRGARAYLDGLNERGGISGHPVVIRTLDDRYDPEPAVANTLRFLDDAEVAVLFNYVGTPTVTRVLPLLKLKSRAEMLLDTELVKLWTQRDILLFFAFSGAQSLREPPYGDFVFNLRASYRNETDALVRHFAANGRRRIGVFYQADAYGRSGWDGVRRAGPRHRAALAAEATYRRGAGFDESFVRQVEILRQAEPDAVIAVGAYAACAGFVRDARDVGWSVPIANLSFVGSESLLAQLRDAGERRGRDYTHGLVNAQVVPSYEDLSLPAVVAYREDMAAHAPQLEPGFAPPTYRPLLHSFASFEGWLNAKLLAEILRRAGGARSPARLREVAEGIGTLDLGIGTPVGFSAHDHQGLDRVYLTTVEEGRFVPLHDPAVAAE